jgi:hypothetical protein
VIECLANPEPKFFKSRFNELIARVRLLLICLPRFFLWMVGLLHFLANSPSGRCGIAVTRARRILTFPVDGSYRSRAVRWIKTATPARLPDANTRESP